MKRYTLADYPGAPEGAYVCDEGWLCIGDQSWTIKEWLAADKSDRRRDSRHQEGRGGRTGRPTQYDDARHIRDRIRKRKSRARIRAEAA